jgi:Zc3h12a-like Ribonuclease domain.
MSNFNYIVILNEKHKEEFLQYPNSEEYRICFTPKNVDDDKFILNLALSFDHTFILSNDKYNNYFHKIKNNVFLQESWKLIFESSIINYDIFKEQFYVLKYPELILCNDYEKKKISFISNEKNIKKYLNYSLEL